MINKAKRVSKYIGEKKKKTMCRLLLSADSNFYSGNFKALATRLFFAPKYCKSYNSTSIDR